MTNPQVRDVDGMSKHDVSSEEWREYLYRDAKGETFMLRIEQPKTLYIKCKPGGGSHRVVCKDGVAHYMPEGWLSIRWKADPEVEF